MILDKYNEELFRSDHAQIALQERNGIATFNKISLTDAHDTLVSTFEQTDDFFVHLSMKVHAELKNFDVSILIKTAQGTDIAFASLTDQSPADSLDYQPGLYSWKVKFAGGLLMPDNYFLRISIHQPGVLDIDTRDYVMGFKIVGAESRRALNYGIGYINIPNTWETVHAD